LVNSPGLTGKKLLMSEWCMNTGCLSVDTGKWTVLVVTQ
jgi:hypothetical protein